MKRRASQAAMSSGVGRWSAGFVFFVGVICAGQASATVWDPFTGFIDLSAVQAQVDDREEDTSRQEYNLAFNRKLAPRVDFRLSMRYYKFSQELDFVLGGNREEMQPSGELRWSHPHFLLSTSAFRREVTTPERGKIETNDFQSSIRSLDSRYPLIQLNYDRQQTLSPDLLAGQDIRSSRVQARGDYRSREHAFAYSFTHRRGENVISNLTSRGNRHLLRWEGAGNLPQNNRILLTGRYSLSYASQTNETSGSGRVLEVAPVSAALYAQDDAPDLGVLDPRPGLADRNRDDPVEPRIDIGGGSNGQNLGADLGITESIAGIYIYTDRVSGTQPRWDVYGSADNLTWQLVPGFVDQLFNPAFNRYELTFASENFRYIKAVNTGQNEIALVYVTEIEILRELAPETGKTNTSSATHAFDGRANYKIDERWESSLDFTFQTDENIGRSGDRWRSALGWRLLFNQSETVFHSFRWNGSIQDGQKPQASFVENSFGYNMSLSPLETLSGSFSLNDRLSHIDGNKSQNIASAAVDGSALLIPDLTVSLGNGVSQINNYLTGSRLRSWNVRGGFDASLTRMLNLVGDYTHSESRERGVPDVRVRRLYSLGVDWRWTPDIYVRGSLRYSAQRRKNWTQDYLVSWNVSSKVKISAQLFEIESDDVITSFRRSANLNWVVGSGSSLYFRVSEVDLSGVGGSTTESFQQGFRFTF